MIAPCHGGALEWRPRYLTQALHNRISTLVEDIRNTNSYSGLVQESTYVRRNKYVMSRGCKKRERDPKIEFLNLKTHHHLTPITEDDALISAYAAITAMNYDVINRQQHNRRTRFRNLIELCCRWSAIFNAYWRSHSDSSGSDFSAIYSTIQFGHHVGEV